MSEMGVEGTRSTAAVLTTGTELVRGELVDRNSAWLSAALTELGFEVIEHRSIGDDDEEFMRAFSDLTSRHEVLVVTGGLGPTTDDRTSECVARALGVPLECDEASLRKIEERLASRGFTLGASNGKQSFFPKGALVLENPVGTAPGFSVAHGKARCFFFPGVPREMEAIFESGVRALLEAERPRIVLRKLRTFGRAESHINDALAGVEEKHGVVLGYRASDAEIEVKIFALPRAGENPEAQEERARGAALDVRVALGTSVYAEGETSLAEQVLLALRRSGKSLGTAESCTGGLVASLLTEIPGSSDVFRGSVVAYDNRVKTSLLGVSEGLLREHGAVSEACALAMAEGASRALGADVAISVTGIAGPSGGSPEKPVGLVHFALRIGDRNEALVKQFFGTRSDVRRRAAKYVLFELLARLRKV